MPTTELTTNVLPGVAKDATRTLVSRELQAVAGTGHSAKQSSQGSGVQDTSGVTLDARRQDVNVAETVGRLNELIQDIRRELKFSVDDASGLTVIKVIDTETQELVRQIPPEEVLTLMHHLENLNPSLMMDVKA